METQVNDNENAVKEEPVAQPEATNTAPAAEKPAEAEGSRFEHIRQTVNKMCEAFPKAFIKEGPAVPLKIGIFDDLRKIINEKPELGITISMARAALRLYTSRLKYLYSLKEGAKRVDLEGNEVETVTPEHAMFAKERFKDINEKRKLKKKALKEKEKADAPAEEAQAEAPHEAKAKPMRLKRKASPKPQPQLQGRAAEISELVKGCAVLVVSGEHRYTHGTVAEDASKDTVRVELRSGATMDLPLERVLIPVGEKKA